MSRLLPSEAVGVVSENFQQSVEDFIESDPSGVFKSEDCNDSNQAEKQAELEKKIKKLKKHLQNPRLSSADRLKHEQNVSKHEQCLSEIEEQRTKIQVL